MFRRTFLAFAFVAGATSSEKLLAQPPAISGAQFDIISIKPNTGGDVGAMRTMPDGSFTATNTRIRQIIAYAAPEPVYEFVGLPDWVLSERYDIVARPAPGSHPTRDERQQMLRNMMIERFKVAGRVQEVERDGFALIVARSDGTLGPQLEKYYGDCGVTDGRRCGGKMGSGVIERTGGTIDGLVAPLAGLAGGPVTNRTGLDGLYDLALHYSVRNLNADPSAPADYAPSIFTALEEQLGLKLVPEKTTVKVFVVDHIERPTPN